MASTFQVDDDALEECRGVVSTQKSQFGGISDTFSGTYVSSTAFGKLANSARLVAVVEAIDSAAHEELAKAESLLAGVESSIDKVQSNVASTEANNKALMRG